jgi:hypothetical protein
VNGYPSSRFFSSSLSAQEEDGEFESPHSFQEVKEYSRRQQRSPKKYRDNNRESPSLQEMIDKIS